MKIGIVGDIHIAPRVGSRIDDYFNTCLNKLDEVANNCDVIIILGDVFNTPTIQNSYFIELYSRLNKHIKQGKLFYSIVGNHDVYNYREESLYQTSLGLCDRIQLINVILPTKPVQIGKYTFHTSYIDIDKARAHLQNCRFSENDILLLHLFYEERGECLTYDDLITLGCKTIFLGHEHQPLEYNVLRYPGMSIYRAGSLLRNTAEKGNLQRTVGYFILDNDIEFKPLNVRPANEVFTPAALSGQNLHRETFVQDIDEVLSKYERQSKNLTTIKQALIELQTPETTINYIREKYELVGEKFE